MTDLIHRLSAALADRYTIEREIGRGGMATVYLARDIRHQRKVAVKVLRPDLAAAVGTERFLREIRISAQLNHPNILTLIDSGEAFGPESSDPFLYYVMPYVAGGSLRDRLVGREALSMQAVLAITAAVAAALAHAHRLGVIHRDVKPENILFSEGQAVVADFGIARAISSAGHDGLTGSGFPLGTLGYMSPEQAAGRSDLDLRTDVCGLACVTYEMLVGGTPGVWPTPDEVRVGRFEGILPEHRERLNRLPGRVEQVLVKGLAMRVADRYATPDDFHDALAGAAGGTKSMSDAQVRAIIDLAAERDHEHPTGRGESALSMGGVEQVAAQVGIPPARVREAAREIEAQREPSRFHKGRLVVERTIAGEIPDTAYELMVNELNTRLRFVGTVSGVGSTLHWAGTKPGFVGRDVRVTFTRSDGETHVHIEEHIELRGASIFAPGWGAAGGALSALAIAAGLGLSEAAIAYLVVPLAISGAILTAINLPKGLARHYRPQLEELADRLQEVGRRCLSHSEDGQDTAPGAQEEDGRGRTRTV